MYNYHKFQLFYIIYSFGIQKLSISIESSRAHSPLRAAGLACSGLSEQKKKKVRWDRRILAACCEVLQ